VAQAAAAHKAAPAKAIRDEARRIADGRDGMDISGGWVGAAALGGAARVAYHRSQRRVASRPFLSGDSLT
jgi:hypothetical protein